MTAKEKLRRVVDDLSEDEAVDVLKCTLVHVSSMARP
jgi:hypothetical protein